LTRGTWLGLIFGALVGLAVGATVASQLTSTSLGAAAPAADGVERAVAAALEEPDVLRRTAALGSLLAELPPAALEDVLAGLDEAPALDAGDPELALVATWWARFDPQEALRWTQRDWRAGHGSVVSAVFRAWGHHDPRAAIAAAEQWRFKMQSETGVQKAMVGWQESGAPGLVEYVEGIDDVEQRQLAAEVLARRIVTERGAEGAMAWVEALEDPGFRNVMTVRVASSVAQIDPEIAAHWAEPQIVAAERPTGLPRRVGTRWIRSDPEAAFAWLAGLPAGRDRDDGVTESFRDWIRHDRDAAIAWIEGRELEPWSEPAFGVYAMAISVQRPEDGLAVVQRFEDVELRDMSTTVLLRRWLNADPEAAEAWIASAELSEDVVQRARVPLRIPRNRRS
jgi:hypothetical protein